MDFTIAEAVSLVILVVVFVFDFILVKTGRQSISIATWIAERAHPTLLVGIMLVGTWLSYDFRDDWIVSFAVALILGHLVTSEGAFAANIKSADAWTMAKTRTRIKNFIRPID